MSTQDHIDQLLAQIEGLTSLGGAEEAHAAATEAYRADPNEDTKAAYRAAVDNLVAVRQASRAGRVGHSIGGDAVIVGE